MTPPRPAILCVGSALWDVVGRADRALPPGADVPGRIERAPGGVALNVAAALARLGLRPALLTVVGRDAEGAELLAAVARLGVETAFATLSDDLPTDRYMAIEGPGGLVAAVADARSLEAAGAAVLRPLEDGRLGAADAPWDGPVVLDGNLTATLLARLAAWPPLARADLRVAPASPGKAERLRPLLGHARATLYVNREEAGLICGTTFADAARAAAGLVARGARRALVTDGARGAADGGPGGVLAAPAPAVLVRRVTGAGDAFMAAHLVADLAGAPAPEALARALDAAARHVSGEAA